MTTQYTGTWWAPADETWRDQANCTGQPNHLFFPELGHPLTEARHLCDTCPVTADCLDYALAHHITHGMWGGTSERERRGMRRRIPA